MIAMEDREFYNRVDTVLSEETIQPERWQYLSFADSEFRGAVVVKARGVIDALFKINSLGQNPGGEVFCVEMPEGITPDPDLKFQNRLLTKAEIAELWGEPCKTIREWEEEESTQ